MPTKSSITAGLLVIGALILFAWLLFGCAEQPSPVNVPSTGNVQRSVEDTRENVQRASTSVRAAAQHSESIGSDLDAADRKEVLRIRWMERHRPR